MLWTDARPCAQGQIKLVDYLEPIGNDAVFEVETAARRASLLSKLRQTSQLDTRFASQIRVMKPC